MTLYNFDLSESNFRYIKIMTFNNPQHRRVLICRELHDNPQNAVMYIRDEDPYIQIIARGMIEDPQKMKDRLKWIFDGIDF